MLVELLVRPVGVAAMPDTLDEGSGQGALPVYRIIRHLVPQYN